MTSLSNEERNRILRELDIQGARKFMPPWFSDEGILAGMHKARLHLPRHMTDAERQASLDWLRAGKFQDLGGGPLPNSIDEVKGTDE